MPNAVDAV